MNATWGSVRTPILLLCFVLFFAAKPTFPQAAARVIEPIDNSRRIVLQGNVHPLARTEFDRGAAVPSQPMTRMLLLLKRSDAQETALQTFLEKQHDKSSPSYHQWLTPSDFGALYGPADSDIQAVTQWLTSQGFTVNQVYSGKTVIEFSGNAAQVQSAFGAAIHTYEVNGKSYVANANDPQIPVALAPIITGIVSLNNFPRQSHIQLAGQVQKIAGVPGLQPLFTIPNGTKNFYGVGPADFATVYNSKSLIAGGNDGTGQTIAVVGETNINVADVQAFRQMFGLSANFDSTNIILNGEDPGITSTGEETEADLDVQWAGAVAPGASVKFIVSASTPASQGIDLSALYIIEKNFAGVLSESYGNCESALGSGGNAFYNSVWEQAAAQGITVILSSGDGGSAGCDDFNTATYASMGLAVSGLASTPYNVALGGTDFDDVNKGATYWSPTNNATNGLSALSYIPEIPWNQNCAQIGLTGCGTNAPQGSQNIVAGSGGASNTYPKPKWQMGVSGMPNDSHRDVPDVSLFASPGFNGNGYIICAGTGLETGPSSCNLSPNVLTFAVVGGTSASAPAFAGVMALVNQYQAAHSGSARQGNANYVLYSLAKQSGASCASSTSEASTCVFNDVTKGNSSLPTGGVGVGTNSVPCKAASPNCSVVTGTVDGVLVDPAHSTTEAWTVTAGYDMTSGLGSVNINSLATKWGTVNSVATTTTLTLNPVTGITHGTAENVTVNATVTPTSGTATGDVSLIAKFSDGTTQGLDQFTLASGKIVNATTNSLPGGTGYQVYAHYAGDGTNAPSDSSPVTVTVGEESSQTFIVIPSFDSNGNQTSGNTNTVTYGSNYIIRMYVANSKAVANPGGAPTGTCDTVDLLTCPTGTVTLTDNGAPVGSGGAGPGIFNMNSAGYTRFLSPMLTGGTHNLAASYSGDSSYNSSTSGPTSFTVTPVPTQTQLGFVPSNIVFGPPFELGATISYTVGPNSLAPTGSVTFYDGNTPLTGTVSITPGQGSFSATIITTFSSEGQHSVTVTYAGDTNYAGSTSPPVTVSSKYAVLVSQTESSDTINYGQSITVNAVFSSTAKSPPMTGQVQFSSTTATFGAVTTNSGTDSNGNQILTATVTATPQFPGFITANYAGDANYVAVSNGGDFVNVIFPDFTFSPATGANVVAVAGQAGSGQITIAPVSQSPSTVSLSILPVTISGYNLSLSSQSVNLNGSAANVTISLTPTSAAPAVAPHTQVRRAGLFPNGSRNGRLLGFACLSAVVFVFGIPVRRRSLRAALGLTVTSLLLFAIGCGGGSGSSGLTGGGGVQPTTISLTTSNAKVPQGTAFMITATITSTGTHPPTGNVLFSNFGVPMGSFLVQNGLAQISSTFFDTPGVYQITASYPGDANNGASTSTSIGQTITGTLSTTVQGSTGNIIHSIPVNVVLQ